MTAVDVLKDGQFDPKRRDDIVQRAFRRGLLLLGCGESAIRFCPPLCVTAEQIDTALRLLDEAIAAK
jgi:4-aminobutyrate aminotransferase